MKALASLTLVSALVVLAFTGGVIVGSKPQWARCVGMEEDMRALRDENETLRVQVVLSGAIARRTNETFRLMGAR